MKRFQVTYEEERPGWDEFMYSRIDTMVVNAEDKDEAIQAFETTKPNKYCMWYQISEIVGVK